MNFSGQNDVPVALSEQCEHQVRIVQKRQKRAAWIPWLFTLGLCFSILGIIPSILSFRDQGSPWGRVIFLASGVLYFGWAVGCWLMWPFRLTPRIVPYFTRELGQYGGMTMTAFARGRGLYREIAALDLLAGTLGVKPLSAFGFAYDHFGQEVHWHAASEGLRTVDALRQGLDTQLLLAPDVAEDLDALASVVRVAADQGVGFSMVLRLYKKDSMQQLCTMESRQGSFW